MKKNMMKKISAITASILTASAAIPCIPYAEDAPFIRNIPHCISTHAIEDEVETIEYISEGKLDIDFNSDGKFDQFDCYLLSRYDSLISYKDALPEAIAAKIAKNADLDGDGEISQNEEQRIYAHFMLNCDIDLSLFKCSTYEAYDDEIGISHGTAYNSNNFSRNFIFDMNSCAVNLDIDYLFLEKMIDEGIVDPDVNNDGKFDIADVLDYKIAITGDLWTSYPDPATGTSSARIVNDKKITLDEEITDRAKKLPLVASEMEFSAIQEYNSASLLDCLFLKEDVAEEYLDNDYYEKFHKNAKFYQIGDMVSDHLEYMKLSVDEIVEQKKNAMQLRRTFEENEKQYFEDIASGKTAPPDLNFDNVLDGNDISLARKYRSDRKLNRTAEESRLTEKEYENISANCDFNNNGISGDDEDLEMMTDYIQKDIRERADAQATDPNGEYYAAYARAIYDKYMSPDHIPDGEDYFHLYDDTKQYEFPTIDELFDTYCKKVGMHMMSKPDIDGNGKIDETDRNYADSYATFLQTGEYGKTAIPDDVLERIKTKCDFTGDKKSGMLYDMQLAVMYIDKYYLKSENITSDEEYTSDTIPEPNKSELTEKCPGDANCDTLVDMSDSVLIMQAISNPSKYCEKGSHKYHITPQGSYNADITGNNDGVTNADALAIQKKLLGL